MYYTEEAYPHERDELPDLGKLLDAVEWDVLCIFDACRWDAFEDVCGASEPVSAPVSHTFRWVDEVVANEERDWSDVTYLSGNPMTSIVSERDEYFEDGGGIEDHVDEHIQLFDDGEVIDRVTGTTLPRKVTSWALNDQWEPPVVVHYFQPHNPFIGKVHLNVTTKKGVELVNKDQKGSAEANLVENGHVSLEMYREAYLHNLELVWEESQRLRNRYDKVITTADHGECLGPESFGHTSTEVNQGAVPFHTNWDVDLPSAESVGASSVHEWVTTGSRNPSEQRENEQAEVGDDLKEKLQALGYHVE